jgi:hypothetical protein
MTVLYINISSWFKSPFQVHNHNRIWKTSYFVIFTTFDLRRWLICVWWFCSIVLPCVQVLPVRFSYQKRHSGNRTLAQGPHLLEQEVFWMASHLSGLGTDKICSSCLSSAERHGLFLPSDCWTFENWPGWEAGPVAWEATMMLAQRQTRYGWSKPPAVERDGEGGSQNKSLLG